MLWRKVKIGKFALLDCYYVWFGLLLRWFGLLLRLVWTICYLLWHILWILLAVPRIHAKVYVQSRTMHIIKGRVCYQDIPNILIYMDT